MIPVRPQPEPSNFHQDVRVPGSAYLNRHAKAKPSILPDYWRRYIGDLYDLYDRTCAYCAHWIPRTDVTVDHFVAKSDNKKLAYEWNNYRLSSPKLNSWKGTDRVIDPFTLAADTFVMDFPSLQVKPNPKLSPSQKQQIQHTINRLKLCGEELLTDRQNWLEEYCTGNCTFQAFARRAPFIAYELDRQGLVSSITSMMQF